MNGRMFRLALAVVISSSVYGYTDSLWIVGGEGYPGELATVEVWLQYEGGGGGDSMSAFDIPLTWDASICTVEAITIGLEFEWWTNKSRIDNDGTKWPPAVPKIGLSVFTFYIFGPPVHRGAHLAGTVDFRILDSAPPSDSACLDTLMEASASRGYTSGLWIGTVRPHTFPRSQLAASVWLNTTAVTAMPIGESHLQISCIWATTYIDMGLIQLVRPM